MTNPSGIHLIDGNDQLTHTKSESKKGMFTSLTILGETSFEFTSTTGNNQNGAIGLRSSSDHVLDEITMPRGVNDLIYPNIVRSVYREEKADEGVVR